MVILLTPVTFVTLVTLITLMSLVTLVTLFRSANEFYRAECITVSGFLLGEHTFLAKDKLPKSKFQIVAWTSFLAPQGALVVVTV